MYGRMSVSAVMAGSVDFKSRVNASEFGDRPSNVGCEVRANALFLIADATPWRRTVEECDTKTRRALRGKGEVGLGRGVVK